ncbi:glycosyltransferase family 2 protein [Lacinutrix sp. MEBiC02595]
MMLSVRLQCYNHGLYIEEAMQSIIKQQTNFAFEVVIGDDFSTDNSLDVIKKVIKKNTNSKVTFNLLKREVGDNYYKNRELKGRLYNFTNILNNCKGKYIALLDGDDYWTDPLKLQKQVDFLEANPDYGICFHEAKIKWDNSTAAQNIEFNSQFSWNNMLITKYDYNMADLLNGPFMATASVVFRNDNVTLPTWFSKAASGDITLYPLILGNKKIKFLNQVMCTYRRHGEGVTQQHKGNRIIFNRIEILHYTNVLQKNKFEFETKNAINNYLNNLKNINLNDLKNLIKLYFKSNIIDIKYVIKSFKQLLKTKLGYR